MSTKRWGFQRQVFWSPLIWEKHQQKHPIWRNSTNHSSGWYINKTTHICMYVCMYVYIYIYVLIFTYVYNLPFSWKIPYLPLKRALSQELFLVSRPPSSWKIIRLKFPEARCLFWNTRILLLLPPKNWSLSKYLWSFNGNCTLTHLLVAGD